ncbi:MAG: cysteine desulfurase [Candidatus Woesearchaeota archaeon]
MRKDFPIFKHLKDLHYLDNAATTQKPKIVIDAISGYLGKENANTHRGIYILSENATQKVADSRKTIAGFINAQPEEIIFVRNTTEGMNQLANSLGKDLKPNEGNIIITEIEHHSNFVPWQQLAKSKGMELRVAKVNRETLLLDPISDLVDDDTAIVAFTAMSNVTGAVFDVKTIIAQIRKKSPDVTIIVDAAQAIAHQKIDVKDLDVDFLCFSMHKIYGLLIGVVYGKKSLLEKMHPFFYGGNMIHTVTIAESTWADLPEKFEAGTINGPAIVASAEAIKYVQSIGMEQTSGTEEKLTKYALKELQKISQVKIIGHTKIKDPSNQVSGFGPIISFTVDGVHPHDLATICNKYQVCIRAGHHCCQPFMDKLGIAATARASIAFYNRKQDIDALITAIKDAIGIITKPEIKIIESESEIKKQEPNTLGNHTPK